MNWDASKQHLFYWYKECPRGWIPYWHESDAGHVIIYAMRDNSGVKENVKANENSCDD